MIAVDSPPGITSPSRPASCAGRRTSTTSAPKPRSIAACSRKLPCTAKTPTLTPWIVGSAIAPPGAGRSGARRYQPRVSSSSLGSSEEVEMPTIGSPRPAETSARILASRKCVVASTIAFARFSGSPDLKMPEPTKTPSAPSCMQSAASAGVAMPPAVNVTTGAPPRAANRGAVLGPGVEVPPGPRLALRPDHRRALGDPPQRLPEVRRTADERDGELPLVDVVGRVGRREHLGLVDVVDLERLEDLRLDEVADAALRHDRDGHGLLDLADLLRIRHARDAALHADVRGNALERHDGHGAGLFGDPRLLGVDDVHDDAALEHLGEPALHSHGADLGHAPSVTGGAGASDRAQRIVTGVPTSIRRPSVRMSSFRMRMHPCETRPG